MFNNFKKLMSYGCICCGAAVEDKSNVMCPECEHIMKYHCPADNPSIVSAISYFSEQSKKLIHYMKDFNDPYVFDYSAGLIEEKLRNTGLAEKLSDFSITYAPRNPKTYIKRRFDQSKEIADFLAVRLFEDDTERVVRLFGRALFSAEQKRLDMTKRAVNAKKQFSVRKNIDIPEKLIIVDDLTTTGSTLYTLRDLAIAAGVKECLLCTVAYNDKRYGD